MFISDHPKAGKQESEIKDKDLISVKKCGVCGAEELRPIGIFRETPEIHFVRCPKCQAVTYDRILSQEATDAMYNDEEYYYEDTDEEGSVTFYGTERFARHLMKYCRTIGQKPVLRLLDFGGGDGSVSYCLAKLLCEKYTNTRFEITVVDYTEKLYKKDEDRITMCHRSPKESIADEKFDILIASAVLEHISVPGETFEMLFSLMGEGSVLYFRTPYRYPLHRLVRKFGVNLDMLYPGHIWDFGGDAWWRRLPNLIGADKAGVSLLASRPSIVEKTFRTHFFVALVSYMMKAPGFLFRGWKYAGGWEAVYIKHQ